MIDRCACHPDRIPIWIEPGKKPAVYFVHSSHGQEGYMIVDRPEVAEHVANMLNLYLALSENQVNMLVNFVARLRSGEIQP